MMSSTACACLVLSSATLHSVSGTVQCHCITRPVAVPNRCPTALALAPGCSGTIATCLTALPGQSC
jgi:hypothetical protein